MVFTKFPKQLDYYSRDNLTWGYGYIDKIQEWRVATRHTLQDILATKTFKYHIGHVGLLEGHLEVIDANFLRKVLAALDP